MAFIPHSLVAIALREWKPLAEKEYASAQNNLGLMYANGEGVSQDDAEAVRWYRLAAEQGQVPAQFFLGLAHGLGKGVPQGWVYAHIWSNIAATYRHEDAAEFRDEAAKLMSVAQIAEAQKLCPRMFREEPQGVLKHPSGAEKHRGSPCWGISR